MYYLDSIEKKTHGTAEFPLAYYYVDETHPHYEMPFHWHRELEISYILSGSYTFYLNDEEIIAHAGDVVFMESSILHGGKPDNCVYECIVFSPKPMLPNIEACKSFVRNLVGTGAHIRMHFPAGTHPICAVTKQLMEAARMQSPGRELAILTHLYEWFITIDKTDSYTSFNGNALPDPKKIQVMKSVLEYIETHYTEAMSLEELARISGLSVSHFCRCFKNTIHKAPIDYINYYRIERSCQLLTTTRLSVINVAYQVGFNDSGYFGRIFKKYKGMTPLEYRMQYE